MTTQKPATGLVRPRLSAESGKLSAVIRYRCTRPTPYFDGLLGKRNRAGEAALSHL